MTRQSAWRSMLYLSLACASQAHAQASDSDFCRNGLFPREQETLSLGVIQGGKSEKVHFYDDMDGCPSTEARCMRPAYLVPGNEVLVGKSTGDWTCVWYQGKQREFVSWVPKKHVDLRPAPPSPASDWVGTWAGGSDRIRITTTGGQLQLRSRLRWDGGSLPNGEPIAHFGGMNGILKVQGAKAGAVEGDCQLSLSKIGKYLVADDNGACGGINVRHTGVYFRQKK
jgi:hypothetical protein